MVKRLVYGVLISILSATAVYAQDFERITPVFNEYGFLEKWVDDKGAEVDKQASGEGQLKAYAVLPSSYSAIDEGYVTASKNQGNFGTCSFFAMASIMETNAIMNNLLSVKEADLSEAHMVQVCHADIEGKDSRISSDIYNVGSTPWILAVTLMNKTGIEADEYSQYHISDKTRMSYDEDDILPACEISALEIDSFFDPREYTMDEIKQAVMDYGSVSTGMYFNQNYFADNTYTSYYCNSSQTINHNVVIVGWDDAYSKDNFGEAPASDGAWLVKNSHQQAPVFWLSYEDYNIVTMGLATVRPADTYDNDYTYCDGGWTQGIGIRGYNFSVANVFVAEKDEILRAIGVSNYGYEQECRITVWKGKADALKIKPTDGELIEDFNVTLTEDGFYTIALDDGVALEKGDAFSVAVTYLSMNDEQPVYTYIEPAAADSVTLSGHTFTYTSGTGESFYTLGTGEISKNSNWVDLCSAGYGNAHIRAFTDYSEAEAEAIEAEFNRLVKIADNLSDYCASNLDIDLDEIVEASESADSVQDYKNFIARIRIALKQGDLDKDNYIGDNDVGGILRTVAGINAESYEANLTDINNDSSTDLKDVITLLKAIS